MVSLQLQSLGLLFRHDTGIMLSLGPYGPYGYLTDEAEIRRAIEWQDRHKEFIFLRDKLDLSIALDYNFASDRTYTELGLAEHNAKTKRDATAIDRLAIACVRAISTVTFYSDCDAVCCVSAVAK